VDLEIKKSREDKNIYVVGGTKPIINKDNMIKRKWKGNLDVISVTN
jgi:hypothetical protein